MAQFDCTGFIRDAHKLTDAEAQEIVDHLQGVLSERGGERPGIALKRTAQRVAQQVKRAAEAEEQNKLRTILVREAARDFILRDGANAKDVFANFEAFLVGNNSRKSAGLQSIDALSNSMQARVWGNLLNDLEDGHQGITKLFNDTRFNDDVVREMWNLSGKSVTGNEDAFHAARVFDKHKEILREMANAEGAYIARLETHAFAQSHNPLRVFKAGREGWKQDLLQSGWLDVERTFGDEPEKAGAVLDEIWRSITSGRRALRAGDDAKARARPGPKALAMRMSANRVLHFKDPDAFLAYNAKYGDTQPVTGILNGLGHRAHDVALMQRLGPDPEKMFQVLLNQAQDAARGADNPLSGRQAKALMNRYEAVSHRDLVPGDLRIANITSAIKALQNITKLGSALLASITDLATVAANARFHGRGYLSGYADVLTHLASGGTRGDKKRIARLLGVGMDGILGAVARRFNAGDPLPGIMGRLSNQFFKWNGLAWWTDTMKEGFALMMSRHLADNAAQEWGMLNARLRNVLGQYGIGEADWRFVRQAVDEAEGQKFLTPDALERLDAFDGQQALADKLRAYFVNEADFAVPTPGARERAIAMQGFQRGTVPGSVAELFWQFKMFPMTVITRVWDRQFRDSVPAGLLVMLQMTGMGYAAMNLKDIARGRTVRDPLDPKTWAAAMQYGGGAAFFGDLMFTDFRAHGRSLPGAVAGPTLGGTADDLARLYSAAVRGEDAAAEGFRTLMHNAPFANLFYTRAALEYLAIQPIQEWLNPGHTRRMMRRVKDETGQVPLIETRGLLRAIGAQ